MATLSRELRRELERTVIRARREAESGAKKALEQVAVQNHEPWSGMTTDQRSLRNRLRAHGRQLGDRRDSKSEKQTINHLVTECAYEHWHRMLFARFLAECDLLIEPDSGVPISLSECQELARERGTDWLALASSFAVRMLPQIFRAGDPVLELSLPPETRHVLEELLKSLPREVFVAEDGLGWVYQFWQAEQKDQVNASEVKIGADELAAVTQLFTEDYMVLFLLHNTLGAWWVAKQKTEAKEWRLPGYEWTYLRFKEDGTPAAGNFDGWPRTAKEITVLDPCEGSGHFLVFALPILVALRMEEEGLSREQAVEAVLRDNLFGLELDLRCTQIAAFNLALTAWRMVGHCNLPQLNIACSGLGINAKEEDWVRLAGKDERLRGAMKALYTIFQQAPAIGSLIDPKRIGGNLFVAEFSQVRSLLDAALSSERADDVTNELAVTAKGLVQAARILTDSFTLVATNVPYLGRGKQSDILKKYCEEVHPKAKADLATCFLDRCLSYCRAGGTTGLVTTENWLFLASYEAFREGLLKSVEWDLVARIGEHGFESSLAAGAFVALLILNRNASKFDHNFAGVDVRQEKTPAAKANALQHNGILLAKQEQQLKNPGKRISFESLVGQKRLSEYATYHNGIQTGDYARFGRAFWEIPTISDSWAPQQTTVDGTAMYSGRNYLILWDGENGTFRRFVRERLRGSEGAWIRGLDAWGKSGVLVSGMRSLPATIYEGVAFDNNATVIVPRDPGHLAAIWCYCSSEEYERAVRSLNQKISVTDDTFVSVPFELSQWQRIASEKFPRGLPKPYSEDPTQWLFDGHPSASKQSLSVAVARLVGYRWPRQAGSHFLNCPALGVDGPDRHADREGIVCLNPAKGEQPAASRLRELLSDAFGSDWSPAKQAELLSQVGYGGRSLEDWLRDGFFEQHCELFHQRPFIWHIWDGLKDGFHVLVNYHKLAEPNGIGRRTLEKLIYSYVGDWIERQRADQKAGVEGADARVAAATHLKAQLESILEGEVPYDAFVRWKALHKQPIGWEPDIDDGIRINIRPFMTASVLNGRGKSTSLLRVVPKIKWERDRGNEPLRTKQEYPWFWTWDGATVDFSGGPKFDGNRWNNLHYSRKYKQIARERHAQNESKAESRR